MKTRSECPLCHKQHTRRLFSSYNCHGRHTIDRDDKFLYHECLSCHVRFLSGVKANAAYYKKYYETGYYDGGMEGSGVLTFFVKKLEDWSLKQKEKLILKYASHHKKLSVLDIGCGNGKFLESLDSQIFQKFGVEINHEGAELSRTKGLTIYESDITVVDFKGKKFDVVTLWHVLEHLTNPLKVYKKIHDLLKPDGIVVFATPNTESLGSKIGKSAWFHLDSPRHLILFNKQSTDYLCTQTGIKIVAMPNEFYDYPLDLFWSVQETSMKYLICPFYPLFKYIDREALTVIARRREET